LRTLPKIRIQHNQKSISVGDIRNFSGFSYSIEQRNCDENSLKLELFASLAHIACNW
jgi:hypothetical protein